VTGRSLAGVGSLAFGILAFVSMAIANPPGGTFSVHDATKYTASGHQTVVIVSVYLMLVAMVGLYLLLVQLRAAIDGERATLFAGLGAAAVAAWFGGWLIVAAVPISETFGGNSLPALSAALVYTFSEVGFSVMVGAGGLLLGAALLTFAAGTVSVPAWVRWATAVAGICGLVTLAWFPLFIVFLWAIVVGVWLIVSARAEAPAPAAQPV
jgi:hypothetical protein